MKPTPILFSILSMPLPVLCTAQIYNTTSPTLIPWSPRNTSTVGQSTIVNGTYYLADQTNALIHVIELASASQITTITGFSGVPTGKGKDGGGGGGGSSNGGDGSSDGTGGNTSGKLPGTSGPNGMVVLPDRNELYVGDAGGTIRVIDLSNNSVSGNISTGGQRRADTMAYSPQSGLVLAVNPLEYPRQTPFLSVIDVSTRSVIGNVSLGSSNATFIGQPAWNNATNKFHVPLRATHANPGGEIDEVDPSSMKISNSIPVTDCFPTSIAFGSAQDLFVGCGINQIPFYGGPGFSLVLDMASNGTQVGNISGVSGVGQAVYNPVAKLYYAATTGGMSVRTSSPTKRFAHGHGKNKHDAKSGSNSWIPGIAIVDASKYELLQTIRTDNDTADTVAVDSRTGQMVVPLERRGIAVYSMESNASNANSSGGAQKQASIAAADVRSATTLNLCLGASVVLFWGMMLL